MAKDASAFGDARQKENKRKNKGKRKEKEEENGDKFVNIIVFGKQNNDNNKLKTNYLLASLSSGWRWLWQWLGLWEQGLLQ